MTQTSPSHTSAPRSSGASGSQGPTPRTSAGPSRFQVPAPPPEHQPAVQRVGAALALAAIVIGIPALLYWLSGPPPIPTRLPVREDFTQSLGIQQLLTVLVAIVWLAWLQFVICLAVEMISAVKHRGVPTPVPLSGPSQRLARTLVGALLLTSVVAGTVGSVVSAMSASVRPDITISATVTTPDASPTASALTPTSSPTSGPRTSTTVAPPDTAAPVPATAEQQAQAAQAMVEVQGAPTDSHTSLAPGTKFYVVSAPSGHHHDSLWDIAQKHLGDGRRYQEIYGLNKDRMQPDGRELHLARLILPGWELVMPADAVGVDVVPTPAAAPVPAQAPAPAPVNAPRSGTQGDGANSQANRSDQAPVSQDGSVVSHVTQAMSEPNALVAGLAAGGVLSACLLLALYRVRRRNHGGTQVEGESLDAEVGLRAGADLARAKFVDIGLRGLAARCAVADIPLPMVYAARADDDELSLLISPARRDAPDPWVVHDDGRRWTLSRTSLGRGSVGGPAAYPALVSLGRDEDGTDVFVDLEATDGPVQVTGDSVVARQVAAALAVQLATSPWSDTVRVSAVGMPTTLAPVAGDALNVTDDVEDVVRHLEQRVSASRDDVLSGRLSRRGDDAPEYAVFAAPLEDDIAQRLTTLLSGGRHPVGVIGVGSMPGAQWQLQVDEAGTLTVPLLGLSVQAHRLTDRTAEAVAELFVAAAEEPVAPEREGLRLVPPPVSKVDDGSFAIAPARVGILGPVAIRADGPIDPSRTSLAEEILCYLAVHPGGVHPTVLAAAIWPRGVGDAVATATVERVRDWLGDDPDGAARLRTDPAGRYSLAPSVACDWDAFCVLVDKARSTVSASAETDLLRRALRLVRGRLLEDHSDTRYSWLPRTGLERVVTESVVRVAHRLVELGRTGSDPDGAAEAATAGLRLARESQVLWRDVLELEGERGGSTAVRLAEGEMRRTLDRADVPVDAETEALVDHLMGGADPAANAHA